MNTFLRERLCYEIAMSIGNSLDLKLMLKDSLSTYLRKLNCLAGSVLLEKEKNGQFSFESIYAIPKRMRPSSPLRVAIDKVPSDFNLETRDAFCASLPREIDLGEHKQYTMELPGIGILILMKSSPGLTDADIQSLLPLNAKLADAARSCLANERLQQEIRNRERAEDNYRSIFENSVEGIFQTTIDGHFIELNPALAKLLGFDSAEEVIATVTNIGDQLYASSKDRSRFLNRLYKHDEVSNFETQFIKKDGSLGWASVSARIIRDEDGAPLHIEGLCTDISQRMKALRILRQAKNDAVQLSNMKSSFLSMVSHELRTPLTSILGFAKLSIKQLIKLDPKSDDFKTRHDKVVKRLESNCSVIVSEGERLTELINNVLDLAKLESGSCYWNMEPIDLNEILTHSISTQTILYMGSDVALTYDIEEPLPRLKGDRDRLVQVMLNLLSNAKKFTLAGSVHVSAQTEGSDVVIRVTDTGIGVPQKDREDIFDKFRQSGNTLTDRPKGTGLGLPICKEIVENHGGTLWLETTEGKGSTFGFTLPLERRSS